MSNVITKSSNRAWRLGLRLPAGAYPSCGRGQPSCSRNHVISAVGSSALQRSDLVLLVTGCPLDTCLSETPFLHGKWGLGQLSFLPFFYPNSLKGARCSPLVLWLLFVCLILSSLQPRLCLFKSPFPHFHQQDLPGEGVCKSSCGQCECLPNFVIKSVGPGNFLKQHH